MESWRGIDGCVVPIEPTRPPPCGPVMGYFDNSSASGFCRLLVLGCATFETLRPRPAPTAVRTVKTVTRGSEVDTKTWEPAYTVAQRH